MSVRALWLAALAIGCGGGAATPKDEGTAVMGTLLSKPFAAADAVSFSVTDSVDRKQTYGVVVISNSAGLCPALQAGHFPPSSGNLVIDLFEVDAGNRLAAPTSTGTFTVTDALVGPAKLAGSLYVETDASCGDLAFESEIIQSGTVTLSGAQIDAYSGRFDIKMISHDYVQGTFKSEPCPGAHLASPNPRC